MLDDISWHDEYHRNRYSIIVMINSPSASEDLYSAAAALAAATSSDMLLLLLLSEEVAKSAEALLE